MYCGKCGSEIREGAKFCSKCGAAAGLPAAQTVSTQPVGGAVAAIQDIRKNKRVGLIVIAVAAVAVIAVVIGIVSLFGSKGGGGTGSVVGEWSHSSDLPYTMELHGEFFPSGMEFFEDGSLIDRRSFPDKTYGTYTFSGGRLTITVELSKLTSYTWRYDCVLSGSTMTLTSDEGTTVEYEKQS